MPRSKKRRLIFVLENCKDCDKLDNGVCKKGQLRQKRIRAISAMVHPDETIFIDPVKDEADKELKKLGLPQVWMHDFDIESKALELMPYGEYYFVIHPNGKKQCSIICSEDYEDDDEEEDKTATDHYIM